MIKLFSTLSCYFRYCLKARSRHRIHSPFVFSFVTKVLHDKTEYAEYKAVEAIVSQMRQIKGVIEISDFGAGAGKKKYSTKILPVCKIVESSAVNRKKGRLLFRIARHYSANTIIELGTSLGISTMYLASACPTAKVVTIEGCSSKAEIAVKSFKALGSGNIDMELGSFIHVLPKLLPELPAPDLVFIDGDHRKESVLRYFELLLPYVSNDTIMIFDDIYWSHGMKSAWEQMAAHKQVTVSIELFDTGIILFRKELSKQHFVIR